MKTKHVLALGLGILAVGVSSVDVSAQFRSNSENNFGQNSPAFENLTDQQKQNFKHKARKNYGFWRTWKQDITKNIEKIENGIVVTMTTEKPELLEKIQKRTGEKTRGEVKILREKIANGIKITKTTDNSEIVTRMHKHADYKQLKKSITKKVENISNGVKITVTSDNAEALEKIKSHERKDPKNPEVKKEVVQLSNGVEITITSENEKMVERIQKRAERRKMGGHKKFRKMMDKSKRFNQN